MNADTHDNVAHDYVAHDFAILFEYQAKRMRVAPLELHYHIIMCHIVVGVGIHNVLTLLNKIASRFVSKNKNS